MAPRKSQRDALERETRFIITLYEKLLADLTRHYPSETKSFERDFETIKSRVSAEGLSFLTKCLPKLGKAFDQALDSGIFEVPEGFKRSHQNPTIPAFLQGMWKMCFDSEGHLDLPRADVVRAIRQVCYLVYKYELPYTPAQERAVLDGFVETEGEIAALQIPTNSVVLVARELIADVLEDFDPRDVLPRHGPGAVATGEKLEEKWEFSRLYSAIHWMFPYDEYFVVGGERELLDRNGWFASLVRHETGVAKVCLVPKDSRGPRLISMEPLEYQWIQQGVNRSLMDLLERHSLTSGHINFINQGVNRDLARTSSLYHNFATLDLKDASDRVSTKLVQALFPKRVYPYFAAIRSTATLFPDGRVIPLEKYAPMGSAVCFSVEALVFWGLSVAAVQHALSCSLRDAGNLVYVYGDDIIVPTEAFEAVTEALESCGLKVNRSKCFHRGDFRESCGMDAYLGIDVTPTRISTRWSAKSSDGAAFSSYVAYANSFARKDYDELAKFLFGSCASIFGKLPYGTSNAGYPSETVETEAEAAAKNSQAGFKIRFNNRTQRFEVRVKTVVTTDRDCTLDCWARTLRNLTQGPGRDPSKVAVPRSAKVVWRWESISATSSKYLPR